MKKHSILYVLFFALCILVSEFGTVNIAKADVIVTPSSGFLSSYDGQTSMIRREFYVESEKGYVDSYALPTSSQKINRFVNGEVLFIYWKVELSNGHQWGWVTNKGGAEQWVRMDDLKVIYDNQSFWHDHEAEILTNDGRYDYMLDKYPFETDVVFWKYPNSGIVSHSFPAKLECLYFQNIYKDEKGRVWGYCGYYQLMSGWMLFNDPSTKDLSTLTDKEEIKVVPTAKVDVTVAPSPSVADVTEEPSPENEATSTPNPITPDITDELAFNYELEEEWVDGARVRIDVKNKTNRVLKGWKMQFKFKNKITSLWEAKLVEQKDGVVVVESAEWANPLKPEVQTSFFFNVEGSEKETPKAMQGKTY